jgi:putative tryptophan/tyrosine transport system substrate-binding protein
VLGQSLAKPRIGVLHPGSAKESPAIQREPFERGLRELGWKPGVDVIIDYRYAEGDTSRLPQLASELTGLKVSVIVARGASAINAARVASSSIPVVMAAGNDPIAEGFVQNLSRPGGTITGIALLTFELDGKRLELLKETLPGIRRVAVLTNRDNEPRVNAERITVLEKSAKALGLDVEIFEVRRSADIPGALAGIGRARPDALLVRAEPIVMDRHRREIADAAAKLRIPAVYWWRFYVEDGGLMSYGESIPGFHHLSATYVSRILRGAKAGDLAVERPSKFELVVNLRAAKALGIEIPKPVLFRADELIR